MIHARTELIYLGERIHKYELYDARTRRALLAYMMNRVMEMGAEGQALAKILWLSDRKASPMI